MCEYQSKKYRINLDSFDSDWRSLSFKIDPLTTIANDIFKNPYAYIYLETLVWDRSQNKTVPYRIDLENAYQLDAFHAGEFESKVLHVGKDDVYYNTDDHRKIKINTSWLQSKNLVIGVKNIDASAFSKTITITSYANANSKTTFNFSAEPEVPFYVGEIISVTSGAGVKYTYTVDSATTSSVTLTGLSIPTSGTIAANYYGRRAGYFMSLVIEYN